MTAEKYGDGRDIIGQTIARYLIAGYFMTTQHGKSAWSLPAYWRSLATVKCKSEMERQVTEPLSWHPPPPCRVGDNLDDVDTPALVVDMDALDRNLQALSKQMQQFPNVAVRPHAKAHKCPQLANLQVEHGAVGVCCQTLTEAEAMVYGGGCNNILLSNQLIGKRKLRRLATLMSSADVAVCVDSKDNVDEMSEVATEAGTTFNCVVEVDVGQARCGLPPGEPVAQLAAHVVSRPGVSFKGIQCYQGLNQHVRKVEERQNAVSLVTELTLKCIQTEPCPFDNLDRTLRCYCKRCLIMCSDSRPGKCIVRQLYNAVPSSINMQALDARGIPCNYVTGGGTGSFPYEAASGVFTEVQPGSYVFMDADYNRNLDSSGQPARDFEQSLFVMSTVQSVTPGSRAVVDAGMKAVSMDSGVPLVEKFPALTYTIGGDEHGILKPDGGLKVGDLLMLVPGHCDPTVNLYDWLVGVRRRKVEVIWPVLGRGPGV